MLETEDVNIFDFVAHIRQQRNHLVQEEVGEIMNRVHEQHKSLSLIVTCNISGMLVADLSILF